MLADVISGGQRTAEAFNQVTALFLAIRTVQIARLLEVLLGAVVTLMLTELFFWKFGDSLRAW